MKRNRVMNSRRGFSLLELSLVIAIIGVLMAVAAWNIVGQGDQAKKKATIATMNVVKNAVDSYYLEHSAYPTVLNNLVTAQYLQDPPQDGWARALSYTPTGDPQRPFELRSLGSDGQPGTPDDIDFWLSKND